MRSAELTASPSHDRESIQKHPVQERRDNSKEGRLKMVAFHSIKASLVTVDIGYMVCVAGPAKN